MRLVDTDRAKQALHNRLKNEDSTISKLIEEAFADWLDEQPIAYDVDKVVEELMKSENYSCSPMFSRGIEAAINIVRKGGVDV